MHTLFYLLRAVKSWDFSLLSFLGIPNQCIRMHSNASEWQPWSRCPQSELLTQKLWGNREDPKRVWESGFLRSWSLLLWEDFWFGSSTYSPGIQMEFWWQNRWQSQWQNQWRNRWQNQRKNQWQARWQTGSHFRSQFDSPVAVQYEQKRMKMKKGWKQIFRLYKSSFLFHTSGWARRKGFCVRGFKKLLINNLDGSSVLAEASEEVFSGWSSTGEGLCFGIFGIFVYQRSSPRSSSGFFPKLQSL